MSTIAPPRRTPRMSHRRTWVIVITAIGVLVASELVASLIEPYLPPGREWPTPQTTAKVTQIRNLAETPQPVDVVFLGSSVVVQGIDPVAFNASAGSLTSYNAALDGASLRSVEVWAENVVFPALDPSLVVIGIASRDLNDRGISQQEFYRSLTTSDGIKDVRSTSSLSGLARALERSSALLRIRQQLRQPGNTLLDLVDQGEDSLLPGPYGAPPTDPAAFTYDNSESWIRFWATRHFNDFTFGGQEVEALERLIAQAQSEGRRVVLVEMPVHEDYLKVQPDGVTALDAVHRLLDDLARDHEVELLNLTNSFQPEVFRDPAHLNPDGAEGLAVSLAERLTATTVKQPDGG